MSKNKTKKYYLAKPEEHDFGFNFVYQNRIGESKWCNLCMFESLTKECNLKALYKI